MAAADPTIRLAATGEYFEVTFTSPSGLSHTVRVAIDLAGLVVLRDIMQARAAQPSKEPPIGTPGVPVQAMIDAWRAAGNKPKRTRAEADEAAADALVDGLDLSALYGIQI